MEDSPVDQKVQSKTGKAPGTLQHIGKQYLRNTSLRLATIRQEGNITLAPIKIEELPKPGEDGLIQWIVVEGLSEVNKIIRVCQTYDIEPLIIEDILNTRQRSKFEIYDGDIFSVFRTIQTNKSGKKTDSTQISLFIKDNIFLSFFEKPVELTEHLQQRLVNKTSRLRTNGVDYWAFATLDIVVDQYIDFMGLKSERADKLEAEILNNPQQRTLVKQLQFERQQMYRIKKEIYQLRELVLSINHLEFDFIQRRNEIYYADLRDHIWRLIDEVDSVREILSSLIDIHMSEMSNRLNEVMKILTIFSAIFTPMTFIAGIYGMNFDKMPELHSDWGYPLVWVTFIAIPIALLTFFKRKGWF